MRNDNDVHRRLLFASSISPSPPQRRPPQSPYRRPRRSQKVPLLQSRRPGRRAPGETELKIRALLVDGVLKEWTTGDAHDVTDRSFVVRRASGSTTPCPATNQRQARQSGCGSAALAAGRPRHRPRHRPQAARLRPRRQPGQLVSRLRGLLRRDRQRQKPLRGGGPGGRAQAGAGQKTRGLRRRENHPDPACAPPDGSASRCASPFIPRQRCGQLRYRSRLGGSGGRFGRRSRDAGATAAKTK